MQILPYFHAVAILPSAQRKDGNLRLTAQTEREPAAVARMDIQPGSPLTVPAPHIFKHRRNQRHRLKAQLTAVGVTA